MNIQTHTTPAPEPCNFATKRTCLFIDVDGTLVDHQPRPDDVRIDNEILMLLSRIQRQLQGAVALISGRTLGTLDRLFAPLQIAAAGVHGFERRCAEQRIHRPSLGDVDMGAARARLDRAVAENPGLLLEDKGSGFALHYRARPDLAAMTTLLVNDCARQLGRRFEVIEGYCVVELKPAGHDKATAVEAFLNEDPFMGRIPIYLGDDLSDFDGFGAVRRNLGVDISVGNRVSARWHLENPSAVRSWLQRFAAQDARAWA